MLFVCAYCTGMQMYNKIARLYTGMIKKMIFFREKSVIILVETIFYGLNYHVSVRLEFFVFFINQKSFR